MEDDILMWGVLGSLILSGLAVSVTAWFPRGKRLADWLMVVGATMTPLGLGALILIVEVVRIPYGLERSLMYLCVAAIGMGAILFAMGYAMDRISRRKEQDFRATEQSLLPPPHR